MWGGQGRGSGKLLHSCGQTSSEKSLNDGAAGAGGGSRGRADTTHHEG